MDTLDISARSAHDFRDESRPASMMKIVGASHVTAGKQVLPDKVVLLNPSFDRTPAEMIT